GLHSTAQISRQEKLVRLLGRSVDGHPCVPRRYLMPVVGIHGFHRRPDLVPTVVEEISDEQVRQRAPKVGMLVDELAETEAGVVLAHEAAHPVDADVELWRPPAELRA